MKDPLRQTPDGELPGGGAPDLRADEPPAPARLDPYDGVLLLSFGGPETPQDVMPFLQRVTAGKGVPPGRLRAVAEEYHRHSGRSPLNDLNRGLLEALRVALQGQGLTPRLYLGNLYAAPFLPRTLADARRDGVRRLLVLLTSAYSSRSGCRSYRTALARACEEINREQGGDDLGADVVRPWFNHPAHIGQWVELLRESFPTHLDPRDVTVLFVTHSIPVAMNARSGPHGGAYRAQHLDVASTVADEVGRALGIRLTWELVYCSRSGPPHIPWLEPDICDRISQFGRVVEPGEAAQHPAEPRIRGVVVVPIGFTSDHVEVLGDLDDRAARAAASQGLEFFRVPTVGSGPLLVQGLVDLLLERAAQARGENPDRPVLGRLGPAPAVCPEGCCQEMVV